MGKIKIFFFIYFISLASPKISCGTRHKIPIFSIPEKEKVSI
jgi:hypothetical protein